jgi:mRNA-degrading endonuclease toxin of MazEF toxin-antitoxin module
MVAVAVPGSASAVIPAGNLVLNPGAEAGAGGNGDPIIRPIPNWTPTGNFTVINYGTAGAPTTADSTAIGGGSHLFYGGPSNSLSTASQSIDVSGASTEINAGGVRANLNAYIGGYFNQEDSGKVDAIFKNAGGTELGRLTIGPVTSSDRGTATKVLYRNGAGVVPANTRSITVVLTSIKGPDAGTYNDGFIDNVNVTLAAAAVSQQSPGNLLLNPGAEAGSGSQDGTQVVPTPDWLTTSNFTVLNYGGTTGGDPQLTAADSAAINGGSRFFAGGPDNSVSTASQDVPVSARASGIDAGTLRASLSAYVGGWKTQQDSGKVDAIFKNAAGTELGRITVGPVTASARANQTALLLRATTGAIPASTRTVTVLITATKEPGVGTYNDGYVDNVSLTLSPGTDAVQPTTVQVAKAISWGSGAGCTQAMGTADFGQRAGGSNSRLSGTPFRGCVTSNAAGWSVSVSQGQQLTAGAQAIPKSSLKLIVGPVSGATLSDSSCADAGGTSTSGCALNPGGAFLSGGTLGGGSFQYSYSLAVPLAQPAGSYGGTVTFTASN